MYKTTVSAEEKEKYFKRGKYAKGRTPNKRYLFSDDHPQSETHWQVLRKEGLVPSLSKLPPSSKNNKEKFQKCILSLVKASSCSY